MSAPDPSATSPLRAADARLLYVGSSAGMEGDLVRRESSIPFVGLPAAAMRGRNPLAMARNAITIGRGVVAALGLIRREKPAAILGTGGYVCVPLFLAAALARVPTLLFLPDMHPGWAGRVLARLATRVAVSFADSTQYLPASKVVETGYPVRAEFFNLDRQASRAAFGLRSDLPVLLIYGGSRGSRVINRAIADLLPHLVQWAQIIHVCGREGDNTWLEAARAQLPPELAERHQIFPYLHAGSAQSMVAAFGAADLAICRAGASALGELPAAGLGAVLVPLVAVNQEDNARALAERGAAITFDEADLTAAGDPATGRLGVLLRELLTQPEQREALARNSAALAQPDARQRLATEWWSLARGG